MKNGQKNFSVTNKQKETNQTIFGQQKTFYGNIVAFPKYNCSLFFILSKTFQLYENWLLKFT